VNIPRTVPTRLIFRNNSITSRNTVGYMLQAGDEEPAPTNNNLEGAVITGNRFVWAGTDLKSITHGLFTGHTRNAVIKYNYLDHVPMGIIRKSGNNMSDTGGGVAYNIVRSGAVGINIKGMSNVRIYNNTLYNDRTTSETWRGLIYIYTHIDVTPQSVSHGTKIYNNIFYTKHQTFCIQIADTESAVELESDYNIFYCETGTPMFSYCGSPKTFAEWQALGYDTHSRIINPNFKDLTGFVPAVRLDFGKDLGSTWAEGLSINAKWGTTNPETATQNGVWQVGAIIHKEVVVTPPPVQVPTFSGAVINDAAPSRIELSFSLALATIVPAISAFSVSVNGTSRGVTAVAVSGTKVLLTLASPVTYGDRVTLTYTKPAANPLQTPAGGQVATISAREVTNNRVSPANSPPVINISSPTKSSTSFIAPATITIDANATDADGSVIKVEFFNGTSKLAERTSAPWSFTWKEVAEGTYSIMAIATDNSNSQTSSEPVRVVVEKSAPAVNQIPSVAISTPGNNGVFDSPALISITASAYDPDGTVEKVEYYIGQRKIGESPEHPYTITFESDSAGTYEITAIAFDNLNATSVSEPVRFSINPGKLNPDLLAIYPNPNNGNFMLEVNPSSQENDVYTITIISLSGRTVFNYQTTQAESRMEIDISDSPGGNYIVMAASDGKVLSSRQFVKF
jgi:uncharacterized repeat protein (TIGR02059 family)